MAIIDTNIGFMHTLTTDYMHGSQNGGQTFAMAAVVSHWTERSFYNMYSGLNKMWVYRKDSYTNDFRYNNEIQDLITTRYDMVTPQGAGIYGEGTIQPCYELDDYQMKLGFYGQKRSDGTTGSKVFDLKFKDSEIDWPVIYYMDRDHIVRLDATKEKWIQQDFDKQLLAINKASTGWDAKMALNLGGINRAKDGARFDFQLFGQKSNTWYNARYKLEIRNSDFLMTITSKKLSYNLTYQYQSSINTQVAFTWEPFVVGSGGRRAYDLETKTWSYKNQQEYGFSEYTLDFMSERAFDYNRHKDIATNKRGSTLKGTEAAPYTIDYS
jgi:hypothetical protein